MSSKSCRICNPQEFADDEWVPASQDDCDVVSGSEYPSESEESSSEDDRSDDETQLEVTAHRETRDTSAKAPKHWRQSHKKNQNNHVQRQPRRQRLGNNFPMQKVLMPTGREFAIPIMVTPQHKCSTRPKLIYLGPNNRKSSREYNIVAKEMQNTIADHANCESSGGCFNCYDIVKIHKIIQGCVWRRYLNRKDDVAIEAATPNERMLFHGTDAYWTIVTNGFDERYASTNGQFGAGLYFAQHSSLANQFVFGYFGGNGCPKHHDKNCYICERHMLLCRVTLGNPLHPKSIQNMPHPPPGYHSVEVLPSESGFQYPEYVIYRGEQAYPEYLITYKIVKPDDHKSEHICSDRSSSNKRH